MRVIVRHGTFPSLAVAVAPSVGASSRGWVARCMARQPAKSAPASGTSTIRSSASRNINPTTPGCQLVDLAHVLGNYRGTVPTQVGHHLHGAATCSVIRTG